MSIEERVFELIPEINELLTQSRSQMTTAFGRVGIPLSHPELLPQVQFGCEQDDLFYQQFGDYEPITHTAQLRFTPNGPQAVIPPTCLIDQTLHLPGLEQKTGPELDEALTGLALIVAMEYYAALIYPQDSPEARNNMVVRSQ